MLFQLRQLHDLGEFLNRSGPEFINKVGLGDDRIPALPAF